MPYRTDGNVPVKFTYFEDYHGRRRVTAAYAVMPTEPRTVRVTYAQCSERDKFVKRIGRAVTTGRMNKGLFQTITVDSPLNENVIEAVVKFVLRSI